MDKKTKAKRDLIIGIVISAVILICLVAWMVTKIKAFEYIVLCGIGINTITSAISLYKSGIQGNEDK